MCSNTVCCPLCCQMTFSNIDILRIRLIKAANGPLTCPICQEILFGLDKLTIHLFIHTNMMTTECITDSKVNNMCNFDKNAITLNNDNHNQAKLIKVSSENDIAHAKISLKDQTSSSSLALTTISVDKCGVNNCQQHQPKCDACELVFNSNDLLIMHNKLIHKISEIKSNTIVKDHFRFQCNLCSKIFKMKGSLRIHLKVVHSVNNDLKLNVFEKVRIKDENNVTSIAEMKDILPSSSSSSSSSAVTAVAETIDEAVQCTTVTPLPLQQCNDQIQIIRDSQQEFIVKPITISIPNDEIGKDFQTTNTIEAISIIPVQNSHENSPKSNDSAKIWECDVCCKSFTTKYFLKKHKRLHTGEMPYTCELCGKTFTFQQSYHKHLLYHSDEKPHSCSTCGRAFKELSTLHNHERIHSGEKPFKCENCGKCFRQRVSYLVHKRIHTGVMPYKCSICDKSFRYKVSQRTHKCTGASQCMETIVKNTAMMTATSSPTATTDLLQGLLQAASIIPEESEDDPENSSNHNSRMNKNTNNNNELNDNDLAKSIDEIVAEQCDKMGINGNSNNLTELDENRMSSPSEKLQNLCLYSPTSQPSFIPNLENMNEDTFKQLLFGVDENW